METDRIIEGDCRDVLADLPAESIHACVTDPPYGLAFMGRDWDDFEPREYQQWCEEWAREVKRVLKPGGHLLAFSGNRTHHRLFSGVEDAGFEVRDTVTWHYGSGFPKALDVSKAIDKAADAEREVVGEHPKPAGNEPGGNSLKMSEHGMPDAAEITAPATDAAKEWDGWKTALKPATEYVVVARKPLPGTVAECMQTHGTGALNIGATRIAHDGDDLSGGGADAWDKMSEGYQRPYMQDDERMEEVQKEVEAKVEKAEQEGRYPANVVFDETQAEALDRDVGDRETGDVVTSSPGRMFGESGEDTSYIDRGGPSRYFYTSKATRAERTLDGKIDNAHPTVKPADLMEWLVKLVTAEVQTVIDPFAGSGTTCRAAKDLNRRFIGIEQQAKWADVARVRCGLTPNNPAHVRDDDEQAGLEAF